MTPSRVVGGAALVASVQYFVCEFVTAWGWQRTPYDWGRNFISDLGVPECLTLPSRVVCSPWHAVMNTGFVLQGLLVLVGVATLLPLLPSRPARIAVGALFCGHAVGIVIVGSFPGSLSEELGGDPVRATMHGIGALLAIVLGNLAILTTGALLLRRTPVLAWCSLAAGALGLVAAVSMTSGVDYGLGIGGVERLAVDPIVCWLVVTGALVLREQLRAPRVPAPGGQPSAAGR